MKLQSSDFRIGFLLLKLKSGAPLLVNTQQIEVFSLYWVPWGYLFVKVPFFFNIDFIIKNKVFQDYQAVMLFISYCAAFE